ncbi:Phospholipase/Carboxylesterase superfamily [Aspergillus uvarum CBS 121591]|uniref:Phospholipase/Carboxylesterase superfamily n=1 Tax=Aspergillus uvarum CBS 121591 TaxID=1448315 RepID=A0A319C2F8_9EURO|nr:Phospholipase/Carboxylesterase superfamily [Aspergillus uvarum CBS 121591]PYH80186.1 Phospholipase/Carboxylesterase superfamily [Aspergillus uvarum CBS 121591]
MTTPTPNPSPRAPEQTDFPSHLTVTITHPTSTSEKSPNILLLLHGLGDTAANFTAFARALHLPETTILTLQAPQPLPFDLGGYHWGDDVTFTPAGELDMDAGFTRAVRLLVHEVIAGVLVRKCGYQWRDVLVFGLGQGGMVGLEVASAAAADSGEDSVLGSPTQPTGNDRWLAGVVSIGAPFPLSAVKNTTTQKNRTPVLVVAGRDSVAVTDSAVRRTKDRFEFVEVHRYARRGDGMPRNRDEMLPVMQFLARRLRSWKGVPEGSVEIS